MPLFEKPIEVISPQAKFSRIEVTPSCRLGGRQNILRSYLISSLQYQPTPQL